MANTNRSPRASSVSAQPALETALDAIDGPALIVGPDGRVLRANAAAQALLERDGLNVKTSLAQTVAGAFTELLWKLTPLRDTDSSLGFLALLSISPKERKLDDAVREATRRWKLTARQRQVLELVAQGHTNGLVAEALDVGDRTVEYHVSAIFDKAGVDNRASLIARLLEL